MTRRALPPALARLFTHPDLCTVADFARDNPAFSVACIRDLIYHARPHLNSRGDATPTNGFAPCIVRIGRRILIDRRAFALWVELQRAAPLSDLKRTR